MAYGSEAPANLRRPARQKNRYVLCTPEAPPVEIDIHDYENPREDIYLDYYVGAFAAMERRLDRGGLTFYIQWNSHELASLPSDGPDVVALLLLDELVRLPPYYGSVRLVLRPYSESPAFLGPLAFDRISLMSCAKYLRNLLAWLPTWIRYRVRRLVPGTRLRRQPVEIVPLGYANPVLLPLKPFDERRLSVSFAGSVLMNKRTSLRERVMRSPKEISRRKMLDAVSRFRRAHPSVPMHVGTTDSFLDSLLADRTKYAALLNDTKICLVPRGSTPETYRYFEALRFGCVVICERLPDRPFYRDGPAIQLDGWEELEPLLEGLLNDPERLRDLHRRSLDWWRTHCSEEVLGDRLAERLLNG